MKICTTCGTWYDQQVPELCKICDDDRQYVLETGQNWTSPEQLQKTHSIRFSDVGKGLMDLRISPTFAIGQRAFIVSSPSGNIMWDCIPFIDAAAVAYIKSKGGIRAIAVSHPHFYSAVSAYAEAFDCPVYLHDNDQQWIMYKTAHIHTWADKDKPLWDGIKIINTGGHFPGSTVLYLPNHGEGGALLTADSIFVCRDRRQITCMYSYPNLLPLNKKNIEQVYHSVSDLPFDSIYGGFDYMNLTSGAKDIFERSIKRYLALFD